LDAGFVNEEVMGNLVDSESNSQIPVEDDNSAKQLKQIGISEVVVHNLNHIETDEVKKSKRPSAMHTDGSEGHNQSIIDINNLHEDEYDAQQHIHILPASTSHEVENNAYNNSESSRLQFKVLITRLWKWKICCRASVREPTQKSMEMLLKVPHQRRQRTDMHMNHRLRMSTKKRCLLNQITRIQLFIWNDTIVL
jgi:hypothetical protein